MMPVYPSMWGLIAAGIAGVLLRLPAHLSDDGERSYVPLLPPYIGHNLGQ